MTDDENEDKQIVIATLNLEKALFIIVKEATRCDSIEVCYTSKYTPTVEYILNMLKKGCGWVESERGDKIVKNTRCRFNKKGFCSNPVLLKERGLRDEELKCTESIRCSCEKYGPMDNNRLMVSFIMIEKVGAIRDM